MKRLPLALLAAFGVAFVAGVSGQQAPPADLILTNGKVITVDDQFRIAQAVAVRNGRFVAVGTNQEITRLAGPNTRRIDARGRAVVPGLIDNHAHYQEEGAYWTLELRFDNVETRKEALDRIRAKAKQNGPGNWVYNLGGWSYDQFTDDKRPFTRDELDTIAPDNPVFLQFSRAETFVNSKAIELTGLEAMKEPWIRRDTNGRATGIIDVAGNGRVRNLANFLDAPNGQRAKLPADVIERSQFAMLRDLNRAGLTASGGECQFEPEYREYQRQGRASMRFFCFRLAEGGRGAGAAEKQMAAIPSLKYFDGDEWLDHVNWGENFPGGGGDNLYSVTQAPVPQESWDLFGRFAQEVAKNHIQALLHTQTDVAVEGKLREIEKFQKDAPIRQLRWAFMHMEGVTPEQVDRMKALNMFIAIHPREIVMGGLHKRVWGDKALVMPPLRYIQDSGIKWGLGTDAFEVNQYRPFQTLYWAVTGKMVGGMQVNSSTVTREEALIAHTRHNAYLFFRENDLGSIQPGFLADMVVLDRDYLTVPVEQIKDINSAMTIVGGRVVWDAAAPAAATR
ncbi:MAG: amidohydrolase [Acidimicrobiia bacterium]|nr:amidohydrolase [Acidimicrobiia bacterium]